ncbi:MAG TPA: DUF6263 family protein, partial [Phycisphaerales bacterium]|nr:DUF6263 family protein [Phycisphaerales bacterium]
MRSKLLLLAGASMCGLASCAEKAPPVAEAVPAVPAVPVAPAATPEPVVDVTPQAATVPLRWNLGAGQRATYRLKTRQEAENAVEQMKERASGGTEVLATFEGGAADDKGVFPVRFTFGELFTHEFNLGRTKDSRSTPIKEGELDAMRNAALRAMIGEGGVALVEPSGRVQNILEMQAAYQGARGRIKNPDTQGWLDQMYKFFNPDAMRFNLTTMFGCVPGADAKPGDTWTTTSARDSNAGILAFDRVWTLEGVEEKDGRKFATVTGVTRVTLPENTGLLSSFYNTTVTKGEGTARVVFDLSRGMIESARMETTLEFDNKPK